jgi:hypothetical protein
MEKKPINLCDSCTKIQKCAFRKNAKIKRVEACVSHDKDPWNELAEEEKKQVKQNG